MSDTPHDPGLIALEAALATLQPAAPLLSRDRLMFEAGRRAVRPSRFWPLATVGSSLIAVILGLMLYLQPGPLEHQVPVSVPTNTPLPENQVQQASPPSDNLATKDRPRPWFKDRFTSPEQSLEEILAAPSKSWPDNDTPSTVPLREWLGMSWGEWKELHFLGKTRHPIEGGGF